MHIKSEYICIRYKIKLRNMISMCSVFNVKLTLNTDVSTRKFTFVNKINVYNYVQHMERS